MSSPLVRQLCLLTLLPGAPHAVDAKALADRLEARGFHVHRRTVQRDLVELSTILPVVADERRKPFGWRWADGAELLGALLGGMAPAPGASSVALRLRVPIASMRALAAALPDAHVDGDTIALAVADGEGLRRLLFAFADVVEIVEPRALRRSVAAAAARAASVHATIVR